MSDWQVGDLALCLTIPHPNRESGMRRGGVYTVSRVLRENGDTGLQFENHWDKKGSHIFWRAYGFRKINPPKADEFDREVIDLMTGHPIGEPA